MPRKRAEVTPGSGNVFADLGYPHAPERKLRVELAVAVNRILAERGLDQEAAARLLGIRQPHVSDLARYRLDRFSAERLLEFLAALGRDIEVRIARRRAGRGRTRVRYVPAGSRVTR